MAEYQEMKNVSEYYEKRDVLFIDGLSLEEAACFLSQWDFETLQLIYTHAELENMVGEFKVAEMDRIMDSIKEGRV